MNGVPPNNGEYTTIYWSKEQERVVIDWAKEQKKMAEAICMVFGICPSFLGITVVEGQLVDEQKQIEEKQAPSRTGLDGPVAGT